MDTMAVDIHSRYVQALRTQKVESPLGPFTCPYPGHNARIFQSLDQLYDHAKVDHAANIAGLRPSEIREHLREAIKRKKQNDKHSHATLLGAPDSSSLSLQKPKREHSLPSSHKRPAEPLHSRRSKLTAHMNICGPEFSRKDPYTTTPEHTTPRHQQSHLYDPLRAHEDVIITSQRLRDGADACPPPPKRSTPSERSCQPGHLELQRYDPRYPNLLLQPDHYPISQEQLASEVKSIYAGLTMVETKCIHVNRAQAAAASAQGDSNPNHKLSSDHLQALIALHRTLLSEKHDFFLASQHPSASPALKQLAAKYSMPARMWKHGIHSFLEVLRHRLPDSQDHMLAFIYLAYQMMALLYETVPAFEDTWIECLGDLGRYRMAIEDEDIRDGKAWAGVARAWYTKAAHKSPTVGRLYHHLAILARTNALQPLYCYSRSLASVKPFSSARESILTLLDPILGRAIATYSHALPIDTNCIKAHALLFEKLTLEAFAESSQQFTRDLDNHIGRVTAKWKEQGVYVAVTNITGCFEYGVDDHALRRVFLTALSDVNRHQPLPPGYHCKHRPTYHSNPTRSKAWWHKMKYVVLHIISRLEWMLDGLVEQQNRCFKLVSIPLKSHKSVLATYLCATTLPVVSALDNSSPESSTVQGRAPIFKVESAFDFVILGCMALYLVTMLFLRAKTTLFPRAFRVSFGTMISMGLLSFIVNRDEFANSIRSIVLEIWFTTTLHVGAQYCYDNYAPGLHIISFIGLSSIPGLILLRFPSMNPLDILPPYVAVLALIAWALHEQGEPTVRRQRQDDPERDDRRPLTHDDAHDLENLTPTGRQTLSVHRSQGGAVTSPASLIRRNSNTSPVTTLPNPSVFTISDETDEEIDTLRSDAPGTPRLN